MNGRNWKKYRLSKRLFPTRIIIDKPGQKKPGHLEIGRDAAAVELRSMLNRDVSHMRVTNTRGEWVFMEPWTLWRLVRNSKRRKRTLTASP